MVYNLSENWRYKKLLGNRAASYETDNLLSTHRAAFSFHEPTMSDRKSIGQIGYEAYGEDAGWKAFDGRPMPQWSDLRADIAARWEVAAAAIAEDVRAACREEELDRSWQWERGLND